MMEFSTPFHIFTKAVVLQGPRQITLRVPPTQRDFQMPSERLTQGFRGAFPSDFGRQGSGGGPEDVPQNGPARILLGTLGTASNAIVPPSPINYLAVRLKAGERWHYKPPTGHTARGCTTALSGFVRAPHHRVLSR
jgi:hypothetical protein